MRTMDPFDAPGLWGGAPMPPHPRAMTAERVFRSPKCSAVISHGPVAALAGSILAPGFHAWRGRSGRRTICSIFPVRSEGTSKGLPDFVSAVVIAVAATPIGLKVISVFTLGAEEMREPQVHAAAALGTTQWHVHLVAGGEEDRQRVLRDLEEI